MSKYSKITGSEEHRNIGQYFPTPSSPLLLKEEEEETGIDIDQHRIRQFTATDIEVPLLYHKSYVIGYVLTITLASFVFGYGMVVMNVNIPTLVKFYNWNKTEQAYYIGILTAIVSVGAIIGALSSGKLIEQGRRRILILVSVLIIIGSSITIFGYVSCLIVGRIILGTAIGISTVVCPLFIIEISPKELRGVFGSLHQFLNSAGIMVCMLLGFAIPDPDEVESNPDEYSWALRNWWRFMFFFPVIFGVALLFLLSCYFTKETPLYYSNINCKNLCKLALSRIYMEESRVLQEMKECKEVSRATGNQLSFKDLLTPKFRKLIIVGSMVAIIQQLSGINFVLSYSTAIFNQAQGGDEDHTIKGSKTAVLNLVLGIIPLVFNTIVIFTVERWGRRAYLVWTTLLCGFIHIGNGIFQNYELYNAEIAMVYVYLADFYLALGPICWLYLGEVMPGMALSVATAANWAFAIIVSFSCYPLAQLLIGFDGVFYMLGAFMLLSFVFEYFYVLETKGKSSAEILGMFLRKVEDESQEIEKEDS